MNKLTERLVRLNIYTSEMIRRITGEFVDKPVVYIGDYRPVERAIYEGKNFSLGGDGRRTAVAYILNELGEVYNVCLTKNDPRYPNVWNLVYESTKEDKSAKRIIFMDSRNPDIILKVGFNKSLYEARKGFPPIPKTGIDKKAWDIRMMEYIRGIRDDAPGDIVRFLYGRYGKTARVSKALYYYSLMDETPYGRWYLSRIFKR